MTGEPLGADVPGYVLRGLIGGGTSGHVWRAEPRDHPGRVVAVKRLPLTIDPAAVAAFRRLMTQLGELSHPGILPVGRLVEDQDGVALVMPYAPGGTLAERIARHGGLPSDVVAGLGADLAAALAAAHGAGAVHGAITARNVLFGAEGQPLLADFGVASLLARARPRSASGQAPAGTDSEALAPVARRDVHGLATTLHAALSGTQSDRRNHLEPGSAERSGHASLTVPMRTPDPLAAVIERVVGEDPAGTTTTAAHLATELDDIRRRAEGAVASGTLTPSTSRHAAVDASPRGAGRPRLARWPYERATPTHVRSWSGSHGRDPSRRSGRGGRRSSLGVVVALVVATPLVLATWTGFTRGQAPAEPSASEAVPDDALGSGDPDRVPPDPCDSTAIDGSGNPTADVIADLDGVGCGVPIVWSDGQLIVPAPDGRVRRFHLDADPGDVVLVGDWTCDGRDGIALYRPSSGEVFRFDRVDEQDGEVLAPAERIGEPGGKPRVVTGVDGCDRIVVDAP
jgi:eukaryotic-like serine/threonine-protein kinase